MATNGEVAHQSNGTHSGSQVEVICGPLLNYRRMSGEHTGTPVWHGSVLIVTLPGQKPDAIRVSSAGSEQNKSLDHSFQAERLYEDRGKTFWRYEIQVPFQEQESCWEYEIPRMVAARGQTHQNNPDKPRRFFVPSKHESMRIMFHSCNGFSVGTDMDLWKGPTLWNDVLRFHAEQPFHVMIGGGDQIYNDSVSVNGPLKPWTNEHNPKKRRATLFSEELRAQCDEYYYQNYVRWYGTDSFAAANGQIPQLNIWDDHDIIDGFGSYTNDFMMCHVFRGIGGVAHKYYMLFQHHLPPPESTFTSDAPKKRKGAKEGTAPDPVQIKAEFVLKLTSEDPSYIMGPRPGPYVEERSRSMYCQLGKHIAFAGIDARTERTRHQVNYPETYDLFFKRLSSGIAASKGEIRHLILLLGVPIAYPRLQWLEAILKSPLIGPIKFLNKRFGVAQGLFNHYDGGVDLLDDLDDHYTAHQHKKERTNLVHQLQKLAKDQSVRVTILGGDVHLAAFGRFYSNPKLNIPVENDFRYMGNVISSAITNKPPPQAVANLLAKRNKIHHLDDDTDETLMELWDTQPGEGEPDVKPKAAPGNHATMPSRNYAIICESHSHGGGVQTNGLVTNGEANGNGENAAFQIPDNTRQPLHEGEEHGGATHPAAQGIKKSGLAGLYGLDVIFRVEKTSVDTEGRTQGYGLSIPALHSAGSHPQGHGW